MPVGRAAVFEELQALAEPIARQVGRKASASTRLTPWPRILLPSKAIDHKRESKDEAFGTLTYQLKTTTRRPDKVSNRSRQTEENKKRYYYPQL